MKNRIVTIFGKKGSGKTTLTKAIVNRLGGKCCILSPIDDFELDNVVITECWSLQSIPKALDDQKIGEVVIIRIPELNAVDCLCAYSIYLGEPRSIVIDEIDLYTKSTQLLQVIHYGRHWGINLVCNTRRYADVPRLLTSQSDEIYLFKTTEPRDVEYIRQMIGKKESEEVKSLKQYQYLIIPSLDKRYTKV